MKPGEATSIELIGPKPLDDEEYREYVVSDDVNLEPWVYRINNPKSLYYREGGTTHRIVDAAGVVHCVSFPVLMIAGTAAPVVLRWKPRNAANPVAF